MRLSRASHKWSLRAGRKEQPAPSSITPDSSGTGLRVNATQSANAVLIPMDLPAPRCLRQHCRRPDICSVILAQRSSRCADLHRAPEGRGVSVCGKHPRLIHQALLAPMPVRTGCTALIIPAHNCFKCWRARNTQNHGVSCGPVRNRLAGGGGNLGLGRL